MAKSLRSRSSKVNKRNLRSKVFGHVEEERKQRLSAKLLELSSKTSEGDTSTSTESTKGTCRWHITFSISSADLRREAGKHQDQMAIDLLGSPNVGGIAPSQDPLPDQIGRSAEVQTPTSSLAVPKKSRRVEKRSHSKSKAAMVFPTYTKGKRLGPRLSARGRKQSLKPH